RSCRSYWRSEVTPMPVQTSCPDRAQWSALLDGMVNADEQRELSDHLEHCASCRQRLETLTGAGEGSSDLTQRLARRPPEPESGLQQAIANLKADGSHVDAQTKADDDEIALDFLSPTEEPGLLGRLAHFDVLEVIGRGAMGIVLK